MVFLDLYSCGLEYKCTRMITINKSVPSPPPQWVQQMFSIHFQLNLFFK